MTFSEFASLVTVFWVLFQMHDRLYSKEKVSRLFAAERLIVLRKTPHFDSV